MPRGISSGSKLGVRLRTLKKPLYVIAGESKVNYTSLSAYVSGRFAFRQADLIRLCDYLQCEPEDIWGPVDQEAECVGIQEQGDGSPREDSEVAG